MSLRLRTNNPLRLNAMQSFAFKRKTVVFKCNHFAFRHNKKDMYFCLSTGFRNKHIHYFPNNL